MNYVLQKQLEYAKCPIYIRRRGEEWEYLTVIMNQIYTTFIVSRRSAIQRLLGQDYTDKQISDNTQYMIAMAQTTIDTVLGIEHKT